MPKAFTQKERETIRKELMEEGLKRFMRVGVRGLRVDELCRAVGIAKGSFYSFFSSKEELYFALVNEHDDRHKTEMMDEIRAMTGDAKEVLGLFFDSIMERIRTDPLVQLVKNSDELAYIMRHAPPNYIVENRARDQVFVEEVAALLDENYGLRHADSVTLEGLMTIAFTLSLQEENLRTLEVFTPTVALLREMFISRLIEGPSHD